MVEARGCIIELEPTYMNLNITGSAVIDLISGLTTAIGTGEIGAGELASNSVDTAELVALSVETAKINTGAVTAGKQTFVGAGSPPAGGYNLQAGDTLIAGGSTWVTFPKAFVAAPKVVASPIEEAEDTPAYIHAGSIDTGSFIAVGSAGATGSFTWIAVGSGTW